MGCNFGTKSNPIVIDDSEETNTKKKKEKPKKVEVISSDEETAEGRIKKEKDKKAKFNEKLFEKLSSKVASERKRRKSPKRNEPDKNFQEEIRLLKVSSFIFIDGFTLRLKAGVTDGIEKAIYGSWGELICILKCIK